MNQPLISIIVPVYKVEDYLDQCVATIVNQSYTNLEIILVDDGSPDNCPAMCDAWAEKDSRVRVVHKENGGLSDARNVGMAAATGEWMGFVDSDDYIRPDMYQLLWERIVSDRSDMASCGIQMVWDDTTASRILTRSGNTVLDHDQAMEAILRESWLKQPVWNKLYKTDLIQDIQFPVGKYHEDIFWSYRAVAKARRVSILETPCYYYRQRSGSIMGVEYSTKRLDAIEAKQERMKFIRDNVPKFLPLTQLDLVFACMYHGQLTMQYLKGQQRKQTLDFLRNVVCFCPMPAGPEFEKMAFRHKCWIRLAKRHFFIACWLRNLLNIGM